MVPPGWGSPSNVDPAAAAAVLLGSLPAGGVQEESHVGHGKILLDYQGSGEGTPVRLAVFPVTVLITKKLRPMLEDGVVRNAIGGSG
jgi:hypothetical protein